MNFKKKEIFFTYNGKVVERIETQFNELYPAIGLHSTNEQIYINFGQDAFYFQALKEI